MSWTKKNDNTAGLQKQIDEYFLKEESWKEKEKSLEEALLLSQKKLEELEKKVSKVAANIEEDNEDYDLIHTKNNNNNIKEDSTTSEATTKLLSQLNEQLRLEHASREKSEKLVRNLAKRYRNLIEQNEWNGHSSKSKSIGKPTNTATKLNVDDNKSNSAAIYIGNLHKRRLKEATILSNKLILLANKLEDMQLINHSIKINDLIDEIEDAQKLNL